MIKATCKICGFDKEFEDKYTGKTFKCPNCTSPVKIEINQIISDPKNVNEDFTNIPILSTKSKKKSCKITYLICGSFIFILLVVFIYDKKTNVLISKNNVESQIIVVNSEKEDLKLSNTSIEKSDINENTINNDLQSSSNSENNSSNTGIFKDIMVNYYNDLSNDNYDNLLNYYSDTVDRFVNQLTPASKYQIVNSHKGYNYKYPFHKYELIKIEPYGSQYNSYYVEMRISIKKNQIDDFKNYIVKDVFIFDNNNKINNIRILK